MAEPRLPLPQGIDGATMTVLMCVLYMDVCVYNKCYIGWTQNEGLPD